MLPKIANKQVASILTLLFLAATAVAQEPAARVPAKRRPRVGVVLAGGSARGFAHVGVLKWLYQHRIPVDFIAGTSMGGLVGGLYASGYSPDEMDAFLGPLDWDQVLQLAPPYDALAFRRKEDRADFPNRFELGIKNGEMRLPSGLSPGHGVGLVLSTFSAPYTQMRSFDDLPTPFRCVATDLKTGNTVVFQQGDLFDALRATMSLPAIFSPAKDGEMFLVDGGLLNNLPVDTMKQLGPDVIIAVNLGLPPREDLTTLSLLGVADRAIDVMIAENVAKNLALADLVLTPRLEGLGSGDFPRFAEFRQRGYDEAERKARFLESLALDEAAWQEYLGERNRRRRLEQITPQFVQVEGARGYENDQLGRRLSSLAGKPLKREQVERSLTQITGFGRYERADYRQVQRNGETGLLVRVGEKMHGPPILNTFLALDGTEIDDVRFGVGARLTVMNIGSGRSEWRTDVRLGSQNLIGSEFYWRPGRRGPVFLAPRGYADYSRQGLFDGNARVAEYRVEKLGAGVDLGLALGASNEVRLGYEAIRVNAFVSTGDPLLPSVDGFVSQLRARWAHDTTDSAIVARRGWRILSAIDWVFRDPFTQTQYPVLEARFLKVTPVGQRNLLYLTGAGGTTAGHTPGIEPFILGGPLRLSQLSREQLRGKDYYLGGLFLLHSLSAQPYTFLGRTYFAFGYEIGDAFSDAALANTRHAGTAGIISETAFGALLFGASFGENGERKAFFRLGRIF